LSSLLTFPAAYTFTVVGRPSSSRSSSGSSSSGSGGDTTSDEDGSGSATTSAFVDEIVAKVARATETQLPLPEGSVSVTPRLGGKFVSLSVTVTVRAPEIVFAACAELKKDGRVKMAY
jgi:putative lipoic acid-binding regulatory protein